MLLEIILVLPLLVVMSAASNLTSTPLVTNIFSGGEHLEEPHYADDENALYWVDTTKQIFYRRDMDTGNVTTKQIGYGATSLIVRVKNYPKLLLVSSRSELYFLSWDASNNDTSLRLLTGVDVSLPDNRCNDGKVDAKGRLWFGTMGRLNAAQLTVDKDKATLYMINENNYVHPEIKVRPVSVSNGIAWTADNKTMFYVDSTTYKIDAFDFDLDTAAISNRRTLFNLKANNITGIPDGMTIDTDDNLWVACFGAGQIIKIDSSTGELLGQYSVPSSHVTSVMWGGSDLATLFVTTSTLGLTSEQKAQEPEAGSLFAIENTGSRGYPQNQFVFAHADTY